MVARHRCGCSPAAIRVRGTAHDGEKDRDRGMRVDLAERAFVPGIPDARLVVYSGRSHSRTFTDKRFAPDALAFPGNH